MYRYDINKIRKDNLIDVNEGSLPSTAFVTPQEVDEKVKGKFKEIIDIIFSEPSSLCSKIDDYGSENSSPAVRSFIQNYLTLEQTALPSSPDAETAFETLLPRSMYSRDGLARYSEYIHGLVKDKYNSKSKQDVKTTSSE